MDPGETDVQCALRELREETGMAAADIDLVHGFRFTTQYPVRAKKTGQLHEKTLVVLLARLKRDVPIVVTEHLGYEWFAWNPPHRIQAWTIDPLLEEVARFIGQSSPANDQCPSTNDQTNPKHQ